MIAQTSGGGTSGSGSGDIDAVTADAPITGGGTSGSIVIGADTSVLATQSDISGKANASDLRQGAYLSDTTKYKLGSDSTAGTGYATVSDISAKADKATTITVTGTANQVTSSTGAQDLSTNRTWTLSLPSPVVTPGALTVTGDLTPASNNAYDLGSSSLRWNEAFGVNLDLSQSTAYTRSLNIAHNITSIGTDATFYPQYVLTRFQATNGTSPYTPYANGFTSVVNYGEGANTAIGTAIAFNGGMVVYGGGSPRSEQAVYYGGMRYDSSSVGRAWFADFNLHGSPAQQSLLTGVNMFVNNYYNGNPSSTPSYAYGAITGKNMGGSVGTFHDTASTYPLGRGFVVGGTSTHDGITDAGFRVAYESGTPDSMSWGLTGSKIDTGLYIRNNRKKIMVASDSTDAVKFAINENGYTGIGTGSPGTQVTAGRQYLTIAGSSFNGVTEYTTGQADATGVITGQTQFTDINSSAADKRVAVIGGALLGGTANNRGGQIQFGVKKDNASGITTHMAIDTVVQISSGTWITNRQVGISSTGNSSSTGQHTGFTNYPSFNPAGASVSAIYGEEIISSISGSSLTVPLYSALNLIPNTGASFSGTVTAARGISIANSTVAGGSYTTLTGLFISDLTVGTNNRAIDLNLSSGATKYNIYSGGTAQNYFAGNVGIGDATPAGLFTVGTSDAFQINSSGMITAGSSGTYTPTKVDSANVSSTAFAAQYFRVGNSVTISGKFTVDPTLAATSTIIAFTIPIASNFTAEEEAGGTAFCPTIAAQGAAIYADATNDRLIMKWVSGDVTAQPMHFTVTYQVK